MKIPLVCSFLFPSVTEVGIVADKRHHSAFTIIYCFVMHLTGIASFAPLRRGLGPSRGLVIGGYVAALCAVALGASLAVVFLAGWPPLVEAWGRARPTHAWLNLVGFVTLTIATTLLHFLPTVVGARIVRRRSAFLVVGGLAGSFAILAGAAAVDPGLAPEPVILAVVLFLWTPPHFWSLAFKYREEYAAAGVPMLPVVVRDATAAWIILGHTVLLVALSLLPVMYGLGWIYLTGAVLGGARFLWTSIGLVRDPSPGAAMVNFHASLVQLCLLLAGAILDAWLI